MKEKFCFSIQISMKFVPKVPIKNNPALVIDNGLAPKRRQTIIWTKADAVHWRKYATLEGDELMAISQHNVFT